MAVKKMLSFLVWKKDGKKKLELPLIPDRTPQESLDHYSITYPELATATTGQMVIGEDGKITYEVKETLGTKG